MSTKTTFKRVALVAVAALGFGVLTSVAPATATAVVQGPSASFSLNATSMSLISSTVNTTDGSNSTVFEVSLMNSNGYAAKLQSGESLTATVISGPTIQGVTWATQKDYIKLGWASALSNALVPTVTQATGAQTITSSATPTDFNRTTQLRGGTGTATDYAVDVQTGLGAATATYGLAVTGANTAVVDGGEYVIRIDLLDANGNAIQSSTVKYAQYSSSIASGATVTATVTGNQNTAVALLTSATRNISATLKDKNGGLVRVGANAAPTISGNVVDATPHTADALTFTDAGGDSTAVTDTASGDGVYVATGTLTNSTGTSTVTARYGASTSTASLTVIAAASGYAYTFVTATGKVASSTNYIVPLTTKSVSVSVAAVGSDSVSGTPATGKTMYYTLSYLGCVTADVTTKASIPTKVTTDANGVATVTIAHANPANDCAATVTFTGATGVTAAPTMARTITWKAPVATTVVSDPSTGYKALALSTNKVTWTVLDQFSNPVVGKTATFTMSGANKPTAGLASQVTDAKGQVSYSWTDAKAVAADATLGSDTVAVATVGADTPTTLGSVTVTYVAALPVSASITATYGTTSAGATIVAPATNIGGAAGKAISANDQIDLTDIVTAADPGAVFVKFAPLTSAAAAVSGVPMVVTVTGGAKLLDSVGYLATTRTVYAATTFTIVGVKTGVSTVTAVQGAVTKSVTINFVNADTDARVIAVKESAGTVTATVTDFNGNAVAGVTVGASLSGTGRLGNGATSGTFVTAADGTVSFDVNGAATATVSLSSTYTKASFLAGAGDATGTVVTTGAPAGVRSASVATTGNTVVADSAQAAADAAAEATDAANAATDAANAAAEAADAATAAAQDAADAVAALSTQVSEMIDALKKQITALTNLVIKIQKKVKA